MSGTAANDPPLPPADLRDRSLPLAAWEPRSSVVRLHRLGRSPIHFSRGPVGRFDSPTNRFGVLYAALDFSAAFAEVLLRNPGRVLVNQAELADKAVSVLAISRACRLVDVTGPGLLRLGLDARFPPGPYAVCGAWADAWEAHPDRPDGLLYPSRLDPSQPCVALFDRLADAVEPITEPAPLLDSFDEVVAALDRYGKALDPG